MQTVPAARAARRTERGLYPAIDIEASISRVMTSITEQRHRKYATTFRHFYSLYEQNVDLFNVGAYQRGANLELDTAVDLHPSLLNFLNQDMFEPVDFETSVAALAEVVGGDIIDGNAPVESALQP
jgi:flagellum-specific ATP synthase